MTTTSVCLYVQEHCGGNGVNKTSCGERLACHVRMSARLEEVLCLHMMRLGLGSGLHMSNYHQGSGLGCINQDWTLDTAGSAGHEARGRYFDVAHCQWALQLTHVRPFKTFLVLTMTIVPLLWLQSLRLSAMAQLPSRSSRAGLALPHAILC